MEPRPFHTAPVVLQSSFTLKALSNSLPSPHQVAVSGFPLPLAKCLIQYESWRLGNLLVCLCKFF